MIDLHRLAATLSPTGRKGENPIVSKEILVGSGSIVGQDLVDVRPSDNGDLALNTHI